MKTTVLILVICFGEISARYYQGQRSYYQPYRSLESADSRFRSRSVALRDEPIRSRNDIAYEAVRVADLPVRSRNYIPYEAVRVADLPVRSRSNIPYETVRVADLPVRHNDAYAPYQQKFPSVMDHFRHFEQRRQAEDQRQNTFYMYAVENIDNCGFNIDKSNVIEKNGDIIIKDNSKRWLFILTEDEAKTLGGPVDTLQRDGITIDGKLYNYAYQTDKGMYYMKSMDGNGLAFIKTNSKIVLVNVLPDKNISQVKECLNYMKTTINEDEQNGVF